MKKSKQKKSRIVAIAVVAVFALGLLASVIGMSKTMGEIKQVAVSETPEAILASAGVDDGEDVSLPVAYFDQRSDECVNLYSVGANKAVKARQFEWSDCGYAHREIERGLVDFYLDEAYLPVAKAGSLTSNRGIDMTRWFSSVEGKSKAYTGKLELKYDADNAAELAMKEDDFYPLDDISFSKGDPVNTGSRNHLFTMNFAVPFTVLASGEESFEIEADDDTFVFVGNALVIDMGGIHDATVGKFEIHNNGEVYAAVDGEEMAYSGVQVAKDDGSIVRVFHADRDSADGSSFGIKFTGMSLNVVQTQLAGGDGVQIAYNPNDPSYVAPLGESSVFRPDTTKGQIIMATVEGVMVLVCAVFMVLAARGLVKRKADK